MSRILLLLAHSIEEHDMVRMFHEMGHEVFSIGAYTNPAEPGDDKRPALPQVPYYPDLAKLVEGDQMAHKAHLPDDLIDWADVIQAHHFVLDWLGGQWARIRHKRVIWRTVGQTSPELEQFMGYLRPEGLQIVRYSPKETHNGPWFAGEDAMIRFGKEPDEWSGWSGEDAVVGNVTQDMVGRADACGLQSWLTATAGLPAKPAGPRSEELPGGIGALDYESLRAYWRSIRCHFYTGTLPAPYTLGLIESMMTGVPTVSIGPEAWGLPNLFEGAEIAGLWSNTADGVRTLLTALLNDADYAAFEGARARERAIELFGMDKVKADWAAFLA